VLFVGDDWAEDHHDVEIVDDAGRRLVVKRLREGLAGITALRALIVEYLPELGPDRSSGTSVVKIAIETDRGLWVAALVAAGCEVFAINPMQVARYRQRHSTSGARSDAADAHLLAEIVRVDREHHRPIAGDTLAAEAIKLVARAHQTPIWDRSRAVVRLRAALRDFFPAALEIFDDLDAPEALELLAAPPILTWPPGCLERRSRLRSLGLGVARSRPSTAHPASAAHPPAAAIAGAASRLRRHHRQQRAPDQPAQ
jgi:Transposase